MPQDPVMLLSFLNTQLRDKYSCIEDLCAAYEVDTQSVIDKLKTINYEYNRELNAFK